MNKHQKPELINTSDNGSLREQSLDWFFSKSEIEKHDLKDKHFPNALILHSPQWGFHFSFGQIEEMYRKEMNKDENLQASGNIANEVFSTIFVGMKLYREVSRRNFPTEIKEYTVSKIGKKYFYVAENDMYAINKETLKYTDKNYLQNNFQLYRDKQEILDRREKSKLLHALQDHFNLTGDASRNTLEQLRQVANILGVSDKLK